MDEDEKVQVRSEFAEAANMAPAELDEWLSTEASRSVGDSGGGGESIGHRSGRRIVDIKRKTVEQLDDDDYEHMRTVVGFVHRHLAQRPSGEIDGSRWRYSLMNWGHDPLKD